MPRNARRTRLSIWYRIGYRIRYAVLHVLGPAQLGESNDPHERLRRERARKVAALARAEDAN
jgi:hypothetical protein